MSFLRDKSPVTPKITTPHGPAIRGRRLSPLSSRGLGRGSLSLRLNSSAIPCSGRRRWRGLGELRGHRFAELSPRRDELLHTLAFQHREHVGEIDSYPR